MVALAAGLVGTIVMTIVQTVEMKLTSRKGSLTPAMVAAKTLRFNLDAMSPGKKNVINQLTHFVFGTGLGLFLLVLIYLFNISDPYNLFFWFFVFAWVQGPIVMTGFGVAPPPWQWGIKGNIAHIFFHIVYALGVVGALMFFLNYYDSICALCV